MSNSCDSLNNFRTIKKSHSHSLTRSEQVMVQITLIELRSIVLFLKLVKTGNQHTVRNSKVGVGGDSGLDSRVELVKVGDDLAMVGDDLEMVGDGWRHLEKVAEATPENI